MVCLKIVLKDPEDWFANNKFHYVICQNIVNMVVGQIVSLFLTWAVIIKFNHVLEAEKSYCYWKIFKILNKHSTIV